MRMLSLWAVYLQNLRQNLRQGLPEPEERDE
jgi:hypothetical protein